MKIFVNFILLSIVASFFCFCLVHGQKVSECPNKKDKKDKGPFTDDEQPVPVDNGLGSVPSDKVILHSISKKYIKVPLDHFDETNEEKFYIKFFMNNMHAKSTDAPVYVIIGDLEPGDEEMIMQSFVFYLAKATRGVIVYTDIRHYGFSKTSDGTKWPTDLRFLHTDQMLEDINTLLKRIKWAYKNSKIILYGQFYGGRLAVWTKQKYPENVDAVVAVSAQLKFEVDSEKYMMSVKRNYYDNVDQNTTNNVKRIFLRIIDMIKSNRKEELHEYVHACPGVDLSKEINQQYMFHMYADSFIHAQKLGLDAMRKHCDDFIQNHTSSKRVRKNTADILSRYRQMNIIRSDCGFYNFEEAMGIIKNSTTKELQNHKFYLYQLCHEFGSFDTSTHLIEPFDKLFPVSFSYKICQTLFSYLFDDDTIEKRVENSNSRYGGLKPEVSNVVFVIGELDPWKDNSIAQSGDNRAFIVKKSGSIMKLHDKSNKMYYLRESIKNTLVTWLKLDLDDSDD